jgi:hypothetical protein
VWYEDFAPLGKNLKLMPKWQGPAKINKINDTNACILLPNGKSKVLNVMRLKKFFSKHCDQNNENDIQPENCDFNSEPKITGPDTRAMKKLFDHKHAAQLAINVLCDLSKKHCAMCEWELECSDNPLLFYPIFACQYIKERQSWLINKQSVWAKCKVQLGQHIVANQAQNNAPASNNIHQQCNHFNKSDNCSDKDAFPFQNFNSKELINIQNTQRNSNNLINTDNSASGEQFNQRHNSENLINTMDNEIMKSCACHCCTLPTNFWADRI